MCPDLLCRSECYRKGHRSSFPLHCAPLSRKQLPNDIPPEIPIAGKRDCEWRIKFVRDPRPYARVHEARDEIKQVMNNHTLTYETIIISDPSLSMREAIQRAMERSSIKFDRVPNFPCCYDKGCKYSYFMIGFRRAGEPAVLRTAFRLAKKNQHQIGCRESDERKKRQGGWGNMPKMRIEHHLS